MVVALAAVESLADATPALWLKFLVDSVVQGERRASILFALLLAGMYLVGVIARHFNYVFFRRLELETRKQLDVELMTLVGNIATVAHHERVDHIDRLQLLRSNRELVVTYMRSLAAGLGTAIRIGMAVVLFVQIHPLLLTLPLFALPALLAASRAERIDQETAERIAPDQRLSAHLLELPTKAASGTEVRVFGLTDELVGRHRRLMRSIWRWELPRHAMSTGVRFLGTAVFTVGYMGAVGFVAYLATRGRATVGDVVLAITLAADMSWITESAASLVSITSAAVRAMERYGWLVQYTERANEMKGHAAPIPSPSKITISDLTFHYPGTVTPVLSNINLELHAGTTVALVGENGAGKTTLVKLLCALYEPSSGEIRVDDVRLDDLDPAAWRRKISAGFQDFVRFEFLARETVGVGDLARAGDESAVSDALERAAATDVLRSLPEGLETQLGKSWTDGAELSGGQWQKLALGRALMRFEPSLLILDEPTANLDANAEQLLFERYAAASGSLQAITLLVSHRFSTVRMADRIVVLDKGRIVEQGTHEELQRLGGTYATLYELQARQYR